MTQQKINFLRKYISCLKNNLLKKRKLFLKISTFLITRVKSLKKNGFLKKYNFLNSRSMLFLIRKWLYQVYVRTCTCLKKSYFRAIF